MKSSFLFRTRIIFFCISIFALILITKLFLVQVVHSSSYSERADRQYATPSSNIFERGTIYFSRKDGQLVSAAMQTTGFKLTINPVKIIDEELAFEELSKILNLGRDEFLTKAGKENDPYEEIANHLSKEEADAISLLKIPGLFIYKEKWRFYPGTNLASQSLGFVAYKGDDLGGRYGLERQYDGELSRNKNNPYINFFAEVFSNINKTLFNDQSREGDVVTTIEPSAQSFLEKTLDPSIRAAFLLGPMIFNPSFSKRSTIPAIRGISGPTTVKSILLSLANLTNLSNWSNSENRSNRHLDVQILARLATTATLPTPIPARRLKLLPEGKVIQGRQIGIGFDIDITTLSAVPTIRTAFWYKTATIKVDDPVTPVARLDRNLRAIYHAHIVPDMGFIPSLSYGVRPRTPCHSGLDPESIQIDYRKEKNLT